MKTTSSFLIGLLLLNLCLTLKVDHNQTIHKVEDTPKKPATTVGNANPPDTCSKQFCMQKFGLLPDPFNPLCGQNATCWQQWYGFPLCSEQDLKCWQVAVGFPKNCKDNDYDCWLKQYGFPNCEEKNVECLKKYLDYSCKYDDLNCWKTKTQTINCKWNDWACWVEHSYMDWLCQDKSKAYDCVKKAFETHCQEKDEECWRQTLRLPSKQCQSDNQCFKRFYHLPICKDNDYECWKKLTYSPDCKKGDMTCLKFFFFIPECSKEKDEVQCYKKWLNYPDCKHDDGKCWKSWHEQRQFISGATFWQVSYDDHKQKSQRSHKPVSFGEMMSHRRKSLSQTHQINRQFHMKKDGLIN